MKLLSSENNNINNHYNNSYYKNSKNNINFNDLQDEINSKEFHNFFLKELNRNKNNDDEILFGKKVIFNKQKKKSNISQYSMSLHINKNKLQQNKKTIFPIIYNYFDS